MQVESCAKPLLTIDEVEKVQRQKIASFIGYVFQLTYAATVDKLNKKSWIAARVVLLNTQVKTNILAWW